MVFIMVEHDVVRVAGGEVTGLMQVGWTWDHHMMSLGMHVIGMTGMGGMQGWLWEQHTRLVAVVPLDGMRTMFISAESCAGSGWLRERKRW